MTTLATGQIRTDHMHVLTLAHRYKHDSSPRTKQGIVRNVCAALEIHAALEEEIFYPALEAAGIDTKTAVDTEHGDIHRLVDRLKTMSPSDADYDETFMSLIRQVMHHVADEETILLTEAERRMGDRLGEIGHAMTRRRMELVKSRAGELASSFAQASANKSMLLTGGAVLAGAFLVSRALSRNGDAQRYQA